MRTLQSHIAWCTGAQRTLVAITCATVVAFYMLGYRPLTNRMNYLQATTAAHQVELQANQTKASARNEIAARNEKLRQELDEIRKPSALSETPEVLKELTRFATQSSLKKFEYHPTGPNTRNDLVEQPLAMTFEGNFVDVFDFLRRTEDMQRLIRIRGLTLKSMGHNGGVKAQLAINIYFSAE